jgi:hypothetical protein
MIRPGDRILNVLLTLCDIEYEGNTLGIDIEIKASGCTPSSEFDILTGRIEHACKTVVRSVHQKDVTKS